MSDDYFSAERQHERVTEFRNRAVIRAAREKAARDARLEELLEAARNHTMTPREYWDQRVSFVWGQMIGNDSVSIEDVRRHAEKVYGPRPPL